MRVFTERLARYDLRRPASKRDYNRRLFRAVAPRYGAVTWLLSFGMDALWKRALVRRLPPGAGMSVRALDLACGTGDISLLLARRFPGARIEGLDLSPAMLARARRRPGARQGPIPSRRPEPPALPGRELPPGDRGLRAAQRPRPVDGACGRSSGCCKRGGTAAFLDFNRSPVPWAGPAAACGCSPCGAGCGACCCTAIPRSTPTSPETLALFPDRPRFEALLEELGFRRVRSRLPPGGFVSLTFAVKP